MLSTNGLKEVGKERSSAQRIKRTKSGSEG